MGTPARIFVSHSSKDNPFAQEVSDLLGAPAAAGGAAYQVLIDINSLEDGRPWPIPTPMVRRRARTLRPLQVAAVTYHIAFRPSAEQKVLTLRSAMPGETAARQPLRGDIDGFSLHAAVRAEAHDRKRLEQLCRYITRRALSNERLQLNAAWQLEFKLKTPWRDGTAHLLISPLEFA